MNPSEIIKKAIIEILKNKFSIKREVDEINISIPSDNSHGDLSLNIAMILSKELGQNPRELAMIITEELKKTEELKSLVTNFEVAGPGFINISLESNYFKKQLKEIVSNSNFGNSQSLKGKKIMMEYAHPNPFKSFHIGHLRNIILGESLIRLLESQGAEVIRVNYQGDVGMHIAKCLWSFAKVDPKDYPRTADAKVALLGKCYADGASKFEEDENIKLEIKEINKKIYSGNDEKVNSLWQIGKEWSLEKFHEIYKRVYSHFEREYMESETIPFVDGAIELAKEKNILKESQGAVVFDGTECGLDTRVFLNSEGLPTYEGKELGLALLKQKEYGTVDLHIHNVAVEQISFFKVTFKVKELLWPEDFKDRQYHNAYEFVGLKKGKMSSRKGNVVLGNDILNEAHNKILELIREKNNLDNIDELSEIIGIGAIKYSFLKISPFKYLAFDLDESINFEGDSGPYIQYSNTRAKSILNEIGEIKLDTNLENLLNSKEELSLIKHLVRFPEIIQSASKEYSPNFVCLYLFELSQLFNQFYKNHKVIKAENESDKDARILLTKATSIVIEKGLYLLGIKSPERM